MKRTALSTMMAAVSDPAQTDPERVDLAFAAHPDQPLLPGPEIHTYLRGRRAESPLVPASMMGFPARLITRYHELDAAFRDDVGFPAGPTYATTVDEVLALFANELNDELDNGLHDEFDGDLDVNNPALALALGSRFNNYRAG